MRKKWLYILYSGLCLGLCLFPAAGLFLDRTEHSSENRPLAEFPKLSDEKGMAGLSWLSKAGEWFEEHFAFRSELVTANAKIEASVFGVSADDGVITGSDGWLYYADSLEDYLGINLLEERELFNLAHSLSLIQEYAEGKGISFLFVPVPNKNTLYGGHMPYYTSWKVRETSNYRQLLPLLEAEGVNCLDVAQKFRKSQEILYHRTDSHWTNFGAAMAGQEIAAALKQPSADWTELPYEERADFTGDLAKMLYPADPPLDEECYFFYDFRYEYDGEVDSTFDPKIHTQNKKAERSLVVYRDSFGNALLPFLADAWGEAYFSRVEQFPLADLDTYHADSLVIERVERFLPNLAEHAAVMAAPVRSFDRRDALYEERVPISSEGFLGEWYVAEGTLNQEKWEEEPEVYEKALICVTLDGETYYEAFPVTIKEEGVRRPYGYRAYLPRAQAEAAEDGAVQIYCVPSEGLEKADFAQTDVPEHDGAEDAPAFG